MAFRNLLRVDARSQLGRSTHPEPDPPPRSTVAGNEYEGPEERQHRHRGASGVVQPPHAPPPPARVYSYALQLLHSHHPFVRARGWRDGGSRKPGYRVGVEG
jgi:hypothetical protein